MGQGDGVGDRDTCCWTGGRHCWGWWPGGRGRRPSGHHGVCDLTWRGETGVAAVTGMSPSPSPSLVRANEAPHNLSGCHLFPCGPQCPLGSPQGPQNALWDLRDAQYPRVSPRVSSGVPLGHPRVPHDLPHPARGSPVSPWVTSWPPMSPPVTLCPQCVAGSPKSPWGPPCLALV